MKWRHWAILIVLVLLNYIVFSTAFTRMAAQRHPLHATHTPMPTFTVVVSGPVSWVVLPTSTPILTKAPNTPTPLPTESTEPPAATDVVLTDETPGTEATEAPTAVAPTATPAATSGTTPTPSPTPAATTQTVIHTVKQGEYLALIARQYGVSVQAIVSANNITDPNHIVAGQKLVIPVDGQLPAPTQGPANTAPPAASSTRPPATATRPPATATRPPATATPKPPTATPKPASAAFQFTGTVVWDPQVAPNCSGPAVSRQSVVKDTAGNPINGVRILIDCYGNTFVSHATGTAGEYDAGHYDFAFGQSSPQPWTCTAYVYDLNGERVTSSQVVSISFDTNDCQPGGTGHQVVILNWVKNW